MTLDEEAELVILNISGDAPLGLSSRQPACRLSGGRCGSGSRRGELVDLWPRALQ